MKHTNSPLNHTRLTVALVLAAVLVLIAAAGSAHSAPTPSNATNSILEHLRTVRNSWAKPCSGTSQQNETETRTRRSGPQRVNRLSPRATETLEIQINQSLVELENWREMSKDIDKHTTWNNEDRKKKFAFLAPFKHDERKIFNKLSIYWASLEMVSFLTKGQGEGTVVSKAEMEAVEEVQSGIRQLLCQLQVFNQIRPANQLNASRSAAGNQLSASKGDPRPISPERMSQHLQPFHVQDPNEIRIHIWYVMCRLDCFLNNMQQHMRNRKDTFRKRAGPRQRQGGVRKPSERKIPCDKCPHKPEPKRKPAQQNKQQRQTQQKQQQQQQKHDGQLQQAQRQQQQHKKQQKAPRQQGRQKVQKNHNRAQRNGTRKPNASLRHAGQG